ncbi:saponin hydrolase precursor [Thozetella sp. PMI_491]|nr:saponin hydrolase precursor [Thozetella sp. PMI_491]
MGQDTAKVSIVPAPPSPEPITITELPLPPVATGIYGAGFQAGSFLPDGKHIVALVTFAGAPQAPDPASIYDGEQIILLKTDGTVFPTGDPWKCLTCGVPAANSLGVSNTFDYPNSFNDNKRILFGTNILDCGEFNLTSPDCTPEATHIYPIRWNTSPDGSGAGGAIRELRVHPDDVHLGFNSFGFVGGAISQFAYFSRLSFNPSPTTGEPLVPRYDLVNVTRLFSPDNTPPFSVSGKWLAHNPLTNTVGELRGFSGRGTEVLYIGASVESCNIDVFAVELSTGSVRRLTAHPEYVDPVETSPDDKWTAVMDTRGSNRQMFMAGMRGIPPLIDLIATAVASTTRNNYQRRFFQPYIIDRYGDRGTYFGQKINAEGSGIAGSGAINDPEWNGRADPKWSPDGTQIVYRQDLTTSPACGGNNPLPCYDSPYQGGRRVRFMLATLTSRTPQILPKVQPVSDVVPWGTPYVPGSATPVVPRPAQGTYTLKGRKSGFANVTITDNVDIATIKSVAVNYTNYSDDGPTLLNGYENFTRTNPSYTVEVADWFSDLVQTGAVFATKKTSPGGLHLSIDVLTNILEATGNLTTTIDGVSYLQPANET